MRSNSGRVRALVGVPMTISDAPLWRMQQHVECRQQHREQRRSFRPRPPPELLDHPAPHDEGSLPPAPPLGPPRRGALSGEGGAPRGARGGSGVGGGGWRAEMRAAPRRAVAANTAGAPRPAPPRPALAAARRIARNAPVAAPTA